MHNKIMLFLHTFLYSPLAQAATMPVPSMNEGGSKPKLHLENFKDEIQVLPLHASVSGIQLNLNLEENYKLIQPSKSFIRVYDEHKDFLAKAKMDGTQAKVTLGELHTSKLYIETAIFHCKHNPQGVCIIKKAVFELPLKEGSVGDLILNLELPSGKFSVEK